MRLLVTGAGGQLGCALQSLERRDMRIIPLDHGGLDITDDDAIVGALRDHRPDVLVNAAAYTAVDRAEADVETAFKVNRDGPRKLAAASRAAGIAFIHVSTDFVFDGAASRPYRPEDKPNPLNAYGASKLAGESAVRDAAPDAVVIRTARLYALHGRNFVSTMLRLLQEKGRVAVVADQYGSPTSATNLAEAVVLAAEGKMLGTAGSPMSIVGIRHFADAGIVSWYELAAAVRDEGVAAGMLPCSAAVDPILTEDYRSLARRPRYS